MRTGKTFFSFSACPFFLVFSLLHGLAGAAVLYVPGQYGTIQDALNAAADGDVIRVAPGLYVENIDFLGKAVTVESESGADVTVIDGAQAGSTVTIRNVPGVAVLSGFTVTNGLAEKGGGIFVENCTGNVGIVSRRAKNTKGIQKKQLVDPLNTKNFFPVRFYTLPFISYLLG